MLMSIGTQVDCTNVHRRNQRLAQRWNESIKIRETIEKDASRIPAAPAPYDWGRRATKSCSDLINQEYNILTDLRNVMASLKAGEASRETVRDRNTYYSLLLPLILAQGTESCPPSDKPDLDSRQSLEILLRVEIRCAFVARRA